jgi:DNA polymerase-3 subunit alpha
VGLLAVQNLSVRTRQAILDERQCGGAYLSLQDFLRRTGIGAEECRTLIKAGALDSITGTTTTDWRCAARTRPAMLFELAGLLKQPDSMSDCLFGADAFFASFSYRESPAMSARSPAPFTLQQLCGYEMEALGFPLSAHPLELVHLPDGLVAGSDIRSHEKKRIRMAGLCIAAKLLEARNSGRVMKMLTMEDNTDTFEAVLFPRVYERFAPRTLGRGPFLLEGIVDMSLGSPTLNVDRIENLVG